MTTLASPTRPARAVVVTPHGPRHVPTRTRLSVIVPCLRLDAYVEECVRSLMANACFRQTEVVVVVDGPAPAPASVPALLRDLDNVTVLATGGRSGSGAATNAGRAAATGRYLARMDADDVSLPGRLDLQLALLADRPDVHLCGGTGPLVDADGRTIGRYPAHPAGDARRTLLDRNPVVHSSVVMSAALFDALGGYDARCVRMQDYELLLRAGLRTVVHHFGDVPLVAYRVHGGQTSTRASGFLGLMWRICGRRRSLARRMGRPPTRQVLSDVVYTVAQAVRYAGLRRPRYLTGTNAR